jgi:N-acetylglutamate synthase-like GNAT family acetyltransferase
MNMNNTCNIRPANNQDIPSLIHLCAVLGYTVTEPAFSQRFETITHSSSDQLFVAEENNQVVGFIHVFIKDLLERETAAEIGGLVIDTNMQSKGAGKALVHAAEEWMEQHNCNRMVVKSNIIRKEAHGFYQHLGYEINKQQVVFEKIINK